MGRPEVQAQEWPTPLALYFPNQTKGSPDPTEGQRCYLPVARADKSHHKGVAARSRIEDFGQHLLQHPDLVSSGLFINKE